MKELAKEIAKDLFQKCKDGELAKIGIDEITAAIDAKRKFYDDNERERFIEMVIRNVVWAVR